MAKLKRLFGFCKTLGIFSNFTKRRIHMRRIQRIFTACVFVAMFVFFSATAVNAQAMLSYLYLEVVDSNQKPVADAKIEASALDTRIEASKTTDSSGAARFQSWNSPPIPSAFTISKPDYYSFDLFSLLAYPFKENSFSEYRNLTVELLKIPKNKEEKKLLGNEQIKRDFFAAVLKGDVQTVRKMLKKEIDPNISTDDLRGVPAPKQIPAMLYAAANGDLAVMNEFIKAKINLRDENSNIRNLLAYYIGSINKHISEKTSLPVLNAYVDTPINAGASLKAVNWAGEPLLTIAAKENNPELVKKLIGLGVDINARYGNGSTALTDFIRQNAWLEFSNQQIEITKLLLEAGADPNAIYYAYQDNCDFPLKILVRNARLELVKLLLAYKADTRLKCKNGENALSQAYAGNYNYVELANILIDAGSDVNTANDQGTTPLMMAVYAGNLSIIKKLIDKGADVNAQDKSGMTALVLAVIMKVPVSTVEAKPNAQIVELLLKSGANPNITVGNNSEVSGATALANAIWFEPVYSYQKYQYASDEIIKLLIAYKADLNLTVKYKDSPIISAAKSGRIEALKLLIQAGASVKGEQGSLALKAAREKMQFASDKTNFEQIIKLLEAAGAK